MPKTADSIKAYFSSGKNKDAWNKAKEAAKSSGGFGEYDDGKYEAQLVDIKVGKSEGSGRLQAVLTFKFTSGENKGKTVYQYQGIEDQGIEYLLKTLKILGHNDVDLDELEDTIFKELKKKKPAVSIRLKTKEGSEYQNVYVVKLLDEVETTEEESEEDEDDDNDTDAVESADDSEEADETDEDNDEDGEEESEDGDSDDDDDEDEEDEPKKKSKPEPEEEPEDDEKEKVELKVGLKLKIQHDDEVQKVKIVKIDDENNKIKVKFLDGTKTWITPKEIVDVA